MFRKITTLIQTLTRKPRQMKRESRPVSVAQVQPVRVILVGRPW